MELMPRVEMDKERKDGEDREEAGGVQWVVV